jgi:hypothetical protein
MADLMRWAPKDSNAALVWLLDQSNDESTCWAWDSVAKQHGSLLLHYGASRHCAKWGDTVLALYHALQAHQRDSGNALLDLWLARLLVKTNQAHQARMVLFETRNFQTVSTYGLELEKAVLQTLQRAGRVNPLSLVEAMGRFSQWKLADFEADMAVLDEVFLESLEQYPYDIRRRGPGAALRMVWIGQELRRQGMSGPHILWLGLYERSLGYAFESKGWEFLFGLAHTFDRHDLVTYAKKELTRIEVESQMVLPAAQLTTLHSENMAFLDTWQNWGAHSNLTVGEALQKSERLPFWQFCLREW